MLRGDIVEDDPGACAVSTEQGSSASQLTAAKVMDVIARLPGCDGQSSDPVSAFSQVKLEETPRLLQNSQIRMSRCLDTSSTTQMAQILVKPLKIPWYLLNDTCMIIHELDCCGKDSSKKFC